MPRSPRRNYFLLPLLFVLALLPCLGPAAQAGFTVSGRRLLLDGAPFFARGVCYQPTPIGGNNAVSEPYGDYYTADHAALQDRDLPLLRAMGANLIRLYAWNPGAGHAAFLDRCYNGGERPLYVLVNAWIDPATEWSDAAAVAVLAQQFVAIDANLANHPAVLGLILGNEVNSQNGNGAKPAFWAAMNTIAAAVKAANPSRLVAIAITDAVGQVQANDPAVPALDFWCMQVYRHPTFGSFFADYAAASAKPLLFSEFGLDAYDHGNSREYPDNAAFVGERLATLWNEVCDAACGTGAIGSGACVFEFADEWYKADTADWMRWQHDPGGYAAAWLPDGWGDEEWWGLYAAALNVSPGAPDVLAPRAGVARLTALWTAPPVKVLAQPQDKLVRLGAPAQLTFQATSPLVTTCEWRRDGVLVAGGADGTLAWTTVGWADAGSYQARVVVAGGSVSSNAATLVVHDDDYTSYAAWAAAAFSAAELADPAIAGPLADPDGAGLANLQRYAFATGQRRGYAGAAPVAVTVVAGDTGSCAEVTFSRKTFDPKLQYVVETSTDLANWTTVSACGAGFPRSVTYRHPVPVGSEPRRYFRVRVVVTP